MSNHGEREVKVLVQDLDALRKFYDEWGKKHPVEYAQGMRPAIYCGKEVTINVGGDDEQDN